MKRMLFIAVWFTLFSCDKDKSTETACYTLVERQCAVDPYNPYLQNANTPDDKAKSIQAYLKDQGISNSLVVPNPPYTGAVCLACSCPSGVSYQLSLNVDDTSRLKSLNLSLINKSCE